MKHNLLHTRNAAITIITFLMILVFFPSNQIFSQSKEQTKNESPSPNLHHETKDDDYVPDLRDMQGRSPAYKYTLNNIFTVQVNVDQNGENIIGDAANEPSIAVDPTNRSRMAIGWRQFNTINNNFRQAGFAYTTNGGQSWTFPGVIEPGVFRSDPVLDSDTEGNFYYNSLTNTPEFFCDVFKSSTGGSSWEDGVFAQGGDKQWQAIDNSNGPGEGHIYSSWTSSYSVCSPDFFTRSTDYGLSFENCVSIPNEPYWGTLTVGSDGTLYSGGSIGFEFQFAKSTNAKLASQTVTWDITTTVNLDGSLSYGGGPNPGGLLGQTLIAVDTSNGPYHNYLYMLASVEPNFGSDPLEVMFARSTDGGVTWSSAIKINDDASTTAYQWFGTMSVAPNGRIDVIWLDTRDNPGTFLSALYYSNSTDGGITWSQNQRLSEYFNPHLGWPQQNKMGDYFDMVSDINGASLAWAATFNGEQDVYYSYISDTTLIPVELTSFSASATSDNVKLMWSTATELNNYGFEIERNSDLNDLTGWRTIGFEQGKGTTTETQHYYYSDELYDNVSHKLYYRLKQIDFLGNYEYSNVIEVQIPPAKFSLAQNYPNPFNPVTLISFQLPSNGHVTLKIYDALGKEVAILVDEQKIAGEYSVEFDATGLGSGIYIYTLSSGSLVESKKMVLLK